MRRPQSSLLLIAICVAMYACGGAAGNSSTPPDAGNGSPSTPPAVKNVKRGIAYDLADPADLAAVSPGVSWWYNWSPHPNAGVPADYSSRYAMDFYPMLWNGNFNAADVVAFLKANPGIK